MEVEVDDKHTQTRLLQLHERGDGASHCARLNILSEF